MLIGEGVALSPVCLYHYRAELHLFCDVPNGIEWPPSCATPPPKDTLKHATVNWNLWSVTVLEFGAPLSSFLEEVLYKFLNECYSVSKTYAVVLVS